MGVFMHSRIACLIALLGAALTLSTCAPVPCPPGWHPGGPWGRRCFPNGPYLRRRPTTCPRRVRRCIRLRLGIHLRLAIHLRLGIHLRLAMRLRLATRLRPGTHIRLARLRLPASATVLGTAFVSLPRRRQGRLTWRPWLFPFRG